MDTNLYVHRVTCRNELEQLGLEMRNKAIGDTINHQPNYKQPDEVVDDQKFTRYVTFGHSPNVYSLVMTYDKYEDSHCFRLSICSRMQNENNEYDIERVPDGVILVFVDHLLGDGWTEVDKENQISEIRQFTRVCKPVV